MSDSQWFVIPNLIKLTNKARAIVYNNFGTWNDRSGLDIMIDDVKESEQADFDKMLSHQESLVIVKENVKKERHKLTKKIRYTLNEEMFAEIIHKLNERLVSNIISSLVQRGLVESAFDEESNDFVFWINDEKEKEQPETD